LFGPGPVEVKRARIVFSTRGPIQELIKVASRLSIQTITSVFATWHLP
jgi:hypothetical protein